MRDCRNLGEFLLLLFTCHGENFEVPHAADVLEAKVPDLGTPAEEEGVQRQHGGDVAHANVADVDTPGGVMDHFKRGDMNADADRERDQYCIRAMKISKNSDFWH